MQIHIHRSRSRDEEETYNGYLIRQTDRGWEVWDKGKYYYTYRSLALAKKGIDKLEQALRQMRAKKAMVGGRSAG